MKLAVLLLSVVATAVAGVAPAAPRVPQSDAEVIERLPVRPADPRLKEVRALRSRLQRDPGNLAVAAELARDYFELAAAESDPRYVGYAQAVLGPWWNEPDPPVDVLVMRATLRQYRHDFDGALADLGRALAREPGSARALSLRSVLHLVQARYAESRADCERLAPLVPPVIATGCISFIDGLTGRARAAYDRLQSAYAAAVDASADERLWTLVRLAELAWRLGDAAGAERHFRSALALGVTDGFLLAAYADFLLDQGRPADVVKLLEGRQQADPLLLRIVLAWKALGARELPAGTASLAARFEAARMRGDTTHEQEEARFELHVRGKPVAALALARRNWRVQREPRDARILLESALAAGDAAAGQPAAQWVAQTGIEDPLLRSLAERLGRGR